MNKRNDTSTPVPISTFKANCLRLSADVARTGRTLMVTRYGKPFIEIMPATQPPSLIGSVTQLVSDEEFVRSTGAEWDASR